MDQSSSQLISKLVWLKMILSFDTSQLTANWDNSNKETVHTKE